MTQIAQISNAFFRKSTLRELVAKVSITTLLLPLLILFVGTPFAQAVYSACAAPVSGVPAETSIGSDFKLKPSHGKNFYVDFSKSPALNASYIGYTIKNNTGADKTNVWVKLTDFNQAGANIQNRLLSLANAADYKMQIPILPANSSKTVYFLIAAARESLRADSSTIQTHTVEVFQGDPDTSSITAVGGCNYSFNAVEDVIEAAANKVTSVTVDKATPTLGELVTVIAQGTPGTIGSGDTSATGDRDIVWLSPSAVKTFPTRALRLESVGINFGTVNAGAGCQVSYSEQLLMTGVSACVQNVTYTATYKFRVIGSSTSSVTLAPIANIASGTQVKHTDGSSATTTINLANVATSSKFTLAKTTSVSDTETVGSVVRVPYSVKVTNTGLTDITLDYVLDDPSAGTYRANSGAYVITDKSTPGSSVSINPTLRADNNYYFVGPFTIPGSSSNGGTNSFITFTYVMELSLASTGNTATYTNSASGFVGSQRVSSASSITLTVGDAGAQSVAAAPTATTTAATSVTGTSATLNGSLTVGGSTVSAKFVYGTDSSAVTAATYTTTTSAPLVVVALPGSFSVDSDTSTVLTGLSTGTTYFFKIMVSNSSNTLAYGDVLSFQTGVPTATTTAATSVTTTTATINGTVGTGGDSGAKYYFVYGTNADLLTGTTTSTETLISGSSATLDLTGLTASTTYYFRVVTKNSTGTITVNGDILNFSTAAVPTPTATTTAATSINASSAIINGTVGTGGDAGSKYYFTYGTDSNLVGATSSTEVVISGSSVSFNWTGLSASTNYFFRVVAKSSSGTVTVNGAILSFTTLPAPTATPVVIPPATITWPTPAGIKYPAPLSDTQLNATAMCNGVAVTGTYTYSPALGAILAPGTHTLTVTFNPTSGNCQGSSTTVQIVVAAPAAPTITWPNPAPVTGPHILSPAQLNATCSVPGTLTYEPALGTVLQPGSYTIKVTCTPTDRNYPPVSTTVPLVVEKIATKISWADPAPIIIGTPLTNTQLNALFSVPGTCVYTPTLTTVLPVGVHTLSVTCTPTNGALYSPATTTVKIEVLPISKSTVTPIVIPGNGPTTVAVPKELQGSRSQVVTLGPGLSSASISGARITKTPAPGFSGNTYITISTTINGSATITTIPVAIRVVASPSKTTPITFTEGKIWWTKSPNAKSYEVTVWGQSVCTTTELTCDVARTIGPKTPVVVIAKGNDGFTASSKAVYENKKPLIATAVYFDTAKFIIKPEGNAEIRRVSSIIKKEGFTRLIIEGHTDTKGGIDNQVLSNNRSKATAAAFKKLLPKISTRLSGSAFRKPAATNDTPEGMALNRRSEVLVW